MCIPEAVPLCVFALDPRAADHWAWFLGQLLGSGTELLALGGFCLLARLRNYLLDCILFSEETGSRKSMTNLPSFANERTPGKGGIPSPVDSRTRSARPA